MHIDVYTRTRLIPVLIQTLIVILVVFSSGTVMPTLMLILIQ